jgi:hypothetical protein
MALRRGQDPASAEVINGLVGFSRRAGNLTHGAIETALYDINQIAQGQWFSTATRNPTRRHWADQIARGIKTKEDFNTAMEIQAMHRYPHLAERIRGGETLADIVNPLREKVANELELGGVGAVDVQHSPIWSKLMSFHDPNTKKTRLMTESEAMVLARQQPAWWRTSNGKQMDADMANKLLNIFGQRKS